MGTLLSICVVGLASQYPAPPVLPGFKRIELNYIPYDLDSPYQVFQEHGKLKILNYREFSDYQRAVEAKVNRSKIVEVRVGELPTLINVDKAIKVQGGKVFAIDNGEWGGGIAYIRHGSKKSHAISEKNTLAIEKFPSGVYAIQGLAHLTFWYSDLCKVEREGGKWKASVITNLHTVPRGIGRQGNHFLLLIDDYITTLNLDGTQRELHRIPYIGNRCFNLTVLPNGQIWLGANFGVVGLFPMKNGKYAEFRYVPINAEKTARKNR